MIITISREFGSGGRELGKRLSNVLEIPCYDKEIIQMIAEKQGFDEQYVSHISEKNLQAAYPRTIGCRFTMTPHPVTKQAVTIAVEQQKIIKTFAPLYAFYYRGNIYVNTVKRGYYNAF